MALLWLSSRCWKDGLDTRRPWLGWRSCCVKEVGQAGHQSHGPWTGPLCGCSHAGRMCRLCCTAGELELPAGESLSSLLSRLQGDSQHLLVANSLVRSLATLARPVVLPLLFIRLMLSVPVRRCSWTTWTSSRTVPGTSTARSQTWSHPHRSRLGSPPPRKVCRLGVGPDSEADRQAKQSPLTPRTPQQAQAPCRRKTWGRCI